MSLNVDTRTRAAGVAPRVDAATFWATSGRPMRWTATAAAAADAARLDLAPLAITVDDEGWTLRRGDGTVEVAPGADPDIPGVVLDADAFSDFVAEQRTALGLLIAGRVGGDPHATSTFCDWDAVVRWAIDDHGVHQPGDVTLRALDGSSLDLDQRFRLGDRTEGARALPGRGRFPAPLRRVHRRRDRRARRGLGGGGGAARRHVVVGRPPRPGERYPCRRPEPRRTVRDAATAARRSPLPGRRGAARRRPPPRRPLR